MTIDQSIANVVCADDAQRLPEHRGVVVLYLCGNAGQRTAGADDDQAFLCTGERNVGPNEIQHELDIIEAIQSLSRELLIRSSTAANSAVVVAPE